MPTKQQRKRNRKIKEIKQQLYLKNDALIAINEFFLNIYLPKINYI